MLEDPWKDGFGVVIGGGGLAGLLLAKQLRQTHPELSVLVVDLLKRPIAEATHKVGESSVELGSQYLERLGLTEYLLDKHIIKHGLRFFPGGGELPITQRAELGPAQEPIVRSYQLDRGRFENDLREMILEAGAELLEGARVTDVELGTKEQPHEVFIQSIDNARGAGEPRTVRCRWFVDASGREAILRKKLKLTRGNRHTANASWFRVKGRVDITELAPEGELDWHTANWAKERWRSTNHLMGEGYWVWLIPLSSGNTSVGVVVHDAVHGFESVSNLTRSQAFIQQHEPALGAHLERFEPMDFGCYRGYSYGVARSWSPDRWALVGEAGAFSDPLYSPGTDHIACANSFTEELIRRDLAGADLEEGVRDFNLLYRALIGGTVDLFRNSAKIYGHSGAMATKIYWDNFSYWSYPCQLMQQELYRKSGDELAAITELGKRFVELSKYVQTMLAGWAELAPEAPRTGFRGLPAFPSVLVDAHLALQDRLSYEETKTYMTQRLQEGEEIVAELLLRVLDELGDEKFEAFAELTGLRRWELTVAGERIAAMDSVGLARRKLLSRIARDVERNLGKPARKASKPAVQETLARMIREQPQTSSPVPLGQR